MEPPTSSAPFAAKGALGTQSFFRGILVLECRSELKEPNFTI
jgi:hypothetical protein